MVLNRFYRQRPEPKCQINLTPFEAKALRNQLRGIEAPAPIVTRVLELLDQQIAIANRK